jgi:hypothetical protein
VQRHFGADVLECFHLEVRRSHPRLYRAEGMLHLWRRTRILSGFRSSRAWNEGDGKTDRAGALSCSMRRALRSTAASSKLLTRGGTLRRPRCSGSWSRSTRALPGTSHSSTAPIARAPRCGSQENPVPERSWSPPGTSNRHGKMPRPDLPRPRRAQQDRRSPLGIVNSDLSAKDYKLFRILTPVGLRGRRALRSDG